MTQGIETTTWHDQKPSYNPRPSWLLDANESASLAWKAYDEAIEERLAGIGSHDGIARALEVAREAEAYAVMCREYYSQGLTPALLSMPDEQIKLIVREAALRG